MPNCPSLPKRCYHLDFAIKDGLIQSTPDDLVILDIVPLTLLYVGEQIVGLRDSLSEYLSSHLKDIKWKVLVESVELFGYSFISSAAYMDTANQLNKIVKIKPCLTARDKDWILQGIITDDFHPFV